MKSCEKRNYSLRRDYRRKSQEAPGSARQASRLTSFFLRVGMELQHSLSTKQCYLFLQKKKTKQKKKQKGWYGRILYFPFADNSEPTSKI